MDRLIVNEGVTLSNSAKNPPIPFGLDRTTGELMPPKTSTVNGLTCGLYCPTCIAKGRDPKESDVVFVEQSRRRRTGERGDAYFRHHRKPPEDFDCYRVELECVEPHDYSNTAVETALHLLTKELLAWWFTDDPEHPTWTASTEQQYLGGSFTSDAAIVDDETIYLEVVVTSLPSAKKRDFLMSLDSQVLLINLSMEEHQDALCTLLYEWDWLTSTTFPGPTLPPGYVDRAESIAQEVVAYIFEDSTAVKEVRNRGFYRRQLEGARNDG